VDNPLERSAQYWIDHLGLTPHPEGGFYRETYRSSESVPGEALPSRFAGDRAFSTAICFLLRSHERSALHRIASDELWHFYAGAPLTVHTIDDAGTHGMLHLGPEPASNQAFQVVVPAGVWFGATVDRPDSFSVVGCTVAPGFDFADFELAVRSDLVGRYPQHRDIIERLSSG
jgi:predicted cupin superfamily sugar epimerase